MVQFLVTLTFFIGFYSQVTYFSIQSNEIDGANYELDRANPEVCGVNHEINGANYVNQLSTQQSIQAKYSLFQSSTLEKSCLTIKKLLGCSLDGALDPWSCLKSLNQSSQKRLIFMNCANF